MWLALLVSLALPATASAHQPVKTLSLARGRHALARYEHRFQGTISACHKTGRRRVVCSFTEPAEEQEESGWTQSGEVQATLIVPRRTIVIELHGWARGVLATEPT